MATMNILPTEILVKILKNLGGKDLLVCKTVCRRWEDTVDSLDDKVWLNLCKTEYSEVYEEAYRKASLSWCDLYISFDLWEDIAAADFTVHLLPEHKTENFQVLSNSTLSCAQSIKTSAYREPYDIIAYYDLVKLRKLPEEISHLPFEGYAENDKLMVIDSITEHDDRILEVKCKGHKASLKLTNSCNSWLLYKDEVLYERYYPRQTPKLWHIKWINNNGRVSLTNAKLSKNEVNGDIRDATYFEGELHILKTKSDSISIMRLVGDALQLVYQFTSRDTEDQLKVMKRYGFLWGSPHVYYWLAFNYKYRKNFKKHDVGSALKYGKIVIAGTRYGFKLHIFYDPFMPDGRLVLHKSEPIKTIDLLPYKINDKELERYRERHPTADFSYIENIEVVETLMGHNIVFLFCLRVFVVELKHNR